MLQIDGNAHIVSPRRPRAGRAAENLTLRIATLAAGDLPLIEQFLLETDRETRASRFGSVASDAALLCHTRETLQQARLLLGMFVDDDLRGLLEAYDCGGRRMEVALIVAGGFRRRGFATALLGEAIARGGLIDALTYQLIFAPKNWAMRRIAQKTNARLDLVLGEFCAAIDLPRTSS